MAELKVRDVEGYLAGPMGRHALLLLYGPDRGLVSERAKHLAKRTGLDIDDPFSVSRLDGNEVEANPATLMEAALQVSFLGGKRLVWLRGAGSGSGLTSAVSDVLQERLDDVTIIVEAEELAKGASLRRLVEKSDQAVTLPCYTDDARGLDGLIDTVMGEHGLSIQLDARRFVKSMLGADRMGSRGELEKLALYAAPETTVTLDHVREIMGDASATAIDAVIDALLEGDLAGLDLAFDRLTATKLPAGVLLIVAMRQFHALDDMIAERDHDGRSVAQIVERARPPIFFARRKIFETALRSTGAATVASILDRLQRTQLASRQTQGLEHELVRHTFLAITVEMRRTLRQPVR